MSKNTPSTGASAWSAVKVMGSVVIFVAALAAAGAYALVSLGLMKI